MLHKARGIVLHSVKYSETSVIVKIYTDSLGLKSFLVRGIRSKKSKLKPGFFQPLSLLDLVFYHKEKSSLHSIKELHISQPYLNLPFDIKKSSIALFLNEVLHKSIREEEANPGLFKFLWSSLVALDQHRDNIASFHLCFLVFYSRFLGIQPPPGFSTQRPCFNFREAVFQTADTGGCFDRDTSSALNTIMNIPFGTFPTVEIPPVVRAKLLSGLLLYFHYHLQGFPEIHSHQVLHSVLA